MINENICSKPIFGKIRLIKRNFKLYKLYLPT